MNSLILSVGVRLSIGLFAAFSLYVLLRGHNAPGGGFIGGLIGAAGFVLHAFATDVGQTRALLKVDPRTIGITGMAAALLSGAASALAGAAPFTGLWWFPLDLPLSTVLLFDVGVYLAVFGAILALVFAFEEDA